MKVRYCLLSILIVLIFSGGRLRSQASLDSLLVQVERGNATLKSALHLLEARKLEASTGLTPSNPEIEFGYLWGSPGTIGNRTDFSVTQSFDFPTVYSSKNKLADISKSQAELQYQATRQEILLRTRIAWIEQVYLNKLNQLLLRRLITAQSVLNGFKRKLELGDANQLQVNQAQMKVTAMGTEINFLKQRIILNESALMNLTGSKPIIITDTLLPIPENLVLDTLMMEYSEGYVNRSYLAEVEKRSREVDVVFNKKLPKLTAGYYSEYILGTRLRGVQAGISVPLWEDARAVKSAKAKMVYAQSDAEAYWQQKKNEVQQMFYQYTILKERVIELEQILDATKNDLLLRQAMEAGEISLTEYYYESDFYFQNILNLLDLQKEMLILETTLKKVYF